MKDVEVEIRIFLSDPCALLKWLENSAEFIGTSIQTDVYFEPECKPFIFVGEDGHKDADDWLRLRETEAGCEICFKRWHREPETRKSLYADEIETSVGNGEKMRELLMFLGFRKIAVVKKNRSSWRYGNFQFDCDHVENLGFFVEVEFKGQLEDPTKGRVLIEDFLRRIGVTELKIARRGYPWMMWNLESSHFE